MHLTKTFRNINGVAMKLQNFRRFDEMFKGKGLRAGGGLKEIYGTGFKFKKLQKQVI